MTHIMLDLETAGKTPNAAIIAIGAVAFSAAGVHTKFYTEVNLQSAIDLGGVVDGSTFTWWLKQSAEARAAFINNDKAPDLLTALQLFGRWYVESCGAEVWGNGATFDNVILANAYRRAGHAAPWQYWNDKCYRTIKGFFPQIKLQRIGTHHNAQDDAESQALHLINMVGGMI